METPSRSVGPWRLVHRIGRGGMGEVFEAAHVVEGTPAAVKRMLARGLSEDDAFVSAFRNEVRAVAALDHPNIVGILDQGIDDDGVPFMAMELCRGGSLASTGTLAFREARQVLLDLLDGLAHAHARGIVHRDLKPANVLLDDGVARLADFGIAWVAQAEPAGANLSAGTPSYTAPEQFAGAWRDFGPWTDLYAIGCLAWRLLTGSPPFRVRGWHEAVLAHGARPLPRLPPALGVPPGTEAWLRQLLAKAPSDRFQRAADAAWALLALPDVPDRRMRAAPPPDPQGETLIWLPAAAAAQRAVGPVRTGERPPLPDYWQAPRRPVRRPAGVGLGLWGLRALPVVGRDLEREALWGALRDIHRDGRPRLLLLRGAAGTGKSRLARWLAHRAHETGAAEIVHARHDPAGGPTTGLGAMVATHSRVEGLAPDEIGARLDDPAVADLLCGRLEGAAERRGAVLQWLHTLGSARPVVLWLDDVQWGLDALSLAAAVAREGRDPILVLLTAREEALAESPEAQAALAALPGLRSLTVGPLPERDHHALVAELGLTGELAAAVERRTAGNPLFAVHLVGDWVARGILRPTAAGLALAEGARADLPDDLVALWQSPLSRVLEAHPGARAGLELAALLGNDVDPDEWLAACSQAAVDVPWDAVEALLDAGLATARPTGPRQGWAFVHGMLREALEATADRGAHAACARMLAGRNQPVRQGLHLVAAGQDGAALEPLLAGVERFLGEQDYRLATHPLTVREGALTRLGVPETDPRWGAGRLAAARILRLRGSWAEAEAALDALVTDADRRGWTDLRVRGRADLALVLRGRGRSAEALRVLREGRALAEGDPYPQAVIDMRQCLVLQDLQRFDEGRELGMAAAAHFDAAGNILMAAHVRIALAMGWSNTGELDRARALAERARDDYAAAGTRAGLANAENTLAELDRLEGHLDAAAEGYSRSLRLYTSIHSGHAVLPRVNLGLTLLEQGRWSQALETLEDGAAELARQGRPTLQVVAEAGRLAALACLGRWDDYDAVLDAATTLLEQTSTADGDTCRWARHAAETASGERARRAWRVVARQAALLDRPADLEAAEAALAME